MHLRLPTDDTAAPSATYRDGRIVDVPDEHVDLLVAGGAVPVHYEVDDHGRTAEASPRHAPAATPRSPKGTAAAAARKRRR